MYTPALLALLSSTVHLKRLASGFYTSIALHALLWAELMRHFSDWFMTSSASRVSNSHHQK